MTHREMLYAGFIAVLLAAALSFAGSVGAQGTAVQSDDAAISANVRTALLKDPALKSMDIRVETQDGVVRLRGFVNSTDDIAKAAEVARAVQGVSSVRNDLRVANRPSRA